MLRRGGTRGLKRWIVCAALPGCLLAGAAIFSTGFVHESVQARRQRFRLSLEASLSRALDEAADEAWKRPQARWRSPLEHRRGQGKGHGSTYGKGPAEERYDFSDEGAGGVAASLSPEVVRNTMSPFDGRLGGCLIRHGAKSVDLQLEVGSDGRVSSVRMDVSGSAERCLRSVLQGVRFPSRPGGPAKGSYQIRLQ